MLHLLISVLHPARIIRLILLLNLCSVMAVAQWSAQSSGTTVRFRGVSAVNARVAWASGERGTFART
ncbi:MAG TPA: hypothetical protein VGB17_10080, partial [Pyrinomonadaceae bacterium]